MAKFMNEIINKRLQEEEKEQSPQPAAEQMPEPVSRPAPVSTARPIEEVDEHEFDYPTTPRPIPGKRRSNYIDLNMIWGIDAYGRNLNNIDSSKVQRQSSEDSSKAESTDKNEKAKSTDKDAKAESTEKDAKAEAPAEKKETLEEMFFRMDVFWNPANRPVRDADYYGR